MDDEGGRYPVPRDLNFKTKFIGGIMTIGQLGWIVAWIVPGALAGVLFWLGLHLVVLSLICMIVSGIVGAVFAFFPVDGYPFPEYLKYASRNAKFPPYLVRGGIGKTNLDPVFLQNADKKYRKESSKDSTVDKEIDTAQEFQDELAKPKQNLFERLFSESDE